MSRLTAPLLAQLGERQSGEQEVAGFKPRPDQPFLGWVGQPHELLSGVVMVTCKQCMYMLVESKSWTYLRHAINQCNGRVYRINFSDDTACN